MHFYNRDNTTAYYLNITFTTPTPPRTGSHLEKKNSSTLPSQQQLHRLEQDLIWKKKNPQQLHRLEQDLI